MTDYSSSAIGVAMQGQLAFSKFLSGNDTSKTGAHQAGIYISKPAISILFNKPGEKGQNKDRWVKIQWQDDFETESRFIYYGQGTRNEYRITNFGKGFPFLRPEYTGALFVLVKIEEDYYKAYVLNDEEGIDAFLGAFGLTPAETNNLINSEQATPQHKEKILMDEFMRSHLVEFPSSASMSYEARMISYSVYGTKKLTVTNPDKALIEWTAEEFRLFRAIEQFLYGDKIAKGFASIEEFVDLANTVLNRRKSRAGKSLEHHLAALFDENGLQYTPQAITEGNKRPDFIFPSQEAYANPYFPTERLISLAAKTTCKDRWRQVINEANRLRNGFKYLCTLQQGISVAQMDEMESEKVILVVPKEYIRTYPRERQDRIWTLGKFIDFVKNSENS